MITGVTSGGGGSSSSVGGDVVFSGDLNYVCAFTDINNFTVTGSVLATGGLLVNDVNVIKVGTPGNLTTGDMSGTIAVRANPDKGLSGNCKALNILGTLNGSIFVQGNVSGGITLGQVLLDEGTGDVLGESGGMAGGADIFVGGNVTGDITANSGDLGADGQNAGLIQVGGSVDGTIEAVRGSIYADIYVGGVLITP